jgi:hypothetical protein
MADSLRRINDQTIGAGVVFNLCFYFFTDHVHCYPAHIGISSVLPGFLPAFSLIQRARPGLKMHESILGKLFLLSSAKFKFERFFEQRAISCSQRLRVMRLPYIERMVGAVAQRIAPGCAKALQNCLQTFIYPRHTRFLLYSDALPHLRIALPKIPMDLYSLLLR